MYKLPTVLSFEQFSSLGFYDFETAQKCILRAMKKNLLLDSPMPPELPTRQTLIGRFHHTLMEKLEFAKDESQFSEQIEKEIAHLQSEVDNWQHLKKTGSVSGWPEINSSAIMVSNLLSKRDVNLRKTKGKTEVLLFSKDKRFLGKPDYFNIVEKSATLREYKSASIFEENSEIKKSYLEQILFYSFLLFENFDIENVTAVIESINYEKKQYTLTFNDTLELQSRVHNTFTKTNDSIQEAKNVAELANPAPDTCSQCDKRIICSQYKFSQYQLAAPGDCYVLEGTISSINSYKNHYDITFRETFHDLQRTIQIPKHASDELVTNRKYLIENLSLNSGQLYWTHRSRILDGR